MTRRTPPCRVVPFEERSKLPRVDDVFDRVRVGDLVVVRSRGNHRLARVTKVGRERVYTEYTTEGALRDAEKFGTTPVVTRPSFNRTDAWLRYVGREKGAAS